MSKPRRRHTAEQQAELLRQHVAEKKPVSEVCNEAEIQPSLFYTWQRELLAGAHTVFSTRRAPSRENELEAKISRLEARVARKDQIIAEVNTLIPGAPLRSLSPTSNEYQRAEGVSRAAKPARVARFTLDAPEHSGTIARGERGHPDARRCVNVQPRCHLHAEPTQDDQASLPKYVS